MSYHLVPEEDTKPHNLSKDCWCEPAIQVSDEEGMLDEALYVHNPPYE